MDLSNNMLTQVFAANSMLEAGLPPNFKGLAIGNGWIDARRQYPAYLDYGLKHGLVEPGSDVRETPDPAHALMLIPYPQHNKKAQSEVDICNAGLDKITDKEPIKVIECEKIIGVVTEAMDTK